MQVQNNEELPDLTAQFRFGGDWGHLQFGGILRKVGYEIRVDSSRRVEQPAARRAGVSMSASAINTFGKDKLLLSVVYGEGIASYMNDGGMDLAPTATFDCHYGHRPARPKPCRSLA